LVRSDEWFKPVAMDDRLSKADKDVASDLGQYVALVCDHDVEQDIGALIAEVRRLQAGKSP
jgi:hypothetical protein